MKIEENDYRLNLENFVAKLRNAHVEKIILKKDMEPTFDLTTIPFQFDYSYNITVLTNNGNFKITTSQNSFGLDTFWVEETGYDLSGDKIITINLAVSAIDIDSLNDFAFKLHIKFDDRDVFIYCGEIYDNSIDNIDSYKYKVCDEMLLVFYNEPDAIKFEELSNMCK